MTAYFVFAAACAAYIGFYAAHCIKTGQRTAAAGAFLLIAASVFFAVFPIR
ncbi:MAG: hypothetical protein K6G56_00425 [Clostridiales bacterium]|nr:hypothetical protein [Clostridiales bacterium]